VSGVLVSSAALVLTLAACGSDSDAPATSTPSSAASSVAEAATCPTAEPEDAGDPEWTLAGDTGSVSVIGSTDSSAPVVDIEAPFSVAQTQVQTLQAGDGPVVADDAEVSV
jgi:hypothetical protein